MLTERRFFGGETRSDSGWPFGSSSGPLRTPDTHGATPRRIETTKRFVDAAMAKVREGVVDRNGYQTVFVAGEDEVVYQLTDACTITLPNGSVESRSSLDIGLIVATGTLDNNGKFALNGDVRFNAPRSGDRITQQSLELLSGIVPTEIDRMGREIRHGAIIHPKK